MLSSTNNINQLHYIILTWTVALVDQTPSIACVLTWVETSVVYINNKCCRSFKASIQSISGPSVRTSRNIMSSWIESRWGVSSSNLSMVPLSKKKAGMQRFSKWLSWTWVKWVGSNPTWCIIHQSLPLTMRRTMKCLRSAVGGNPRISHSSNHFLSIKILKK